jgi:hypothetical protein
MCTSHKEAQRGDTIDERVGLRQVIGLTQPYKGYSVISDVTLEITMGKGITVFFSLALFAVAAWVMLAPPQGLINGHVVAIVLVVFGLLGLVAVRLSSSRE